MKHFFRHWHYGIKARVIDGALVADIDTAREPTFVRLDLARLQTVALEIATNNPSGPGDYELNLVNVGAPGASTTLARFEVKDAAEEAACTIRKALLRGSQTHRFRRAFKTTLGVLAALGLAILLLAASSKLGDGTTTNQTAALQSVMQNLQSGGPATPALPAANSGEAVSAEQFLSGVPTPQAE